MAKEKKKEPSALFYNWERVTGIEPVSSAWKANIINHYTIPAYVFVFTKTTAGKPANSACLPWFLKKNLILY